MLEEGNDLNQNGAPPPAKKSGLRSFLIKAGILAGIVILALLFLAGWFFFLSPRLNAQKAAQQATIEAQSAQLAQAMTATIKASQGTTATVKASQGMTATVKASQGTTTPLPSLLATNTSTPPPAVTIPLNSPTSSSYPLTATMAVLQTQVAISQLMPTSTMANTDTLPKSGIADEFGLPGLILTAVALVVVIILVRLLRKTPAR